MARFAIFIDVEPQSDNFYPELLIELGGERHFYIVAWPDRLQAGSSGISYSDERKNYNDQPYSREAYASNNE